MTLEPLELAVLRKLLDGEHPILTALRDQVPGLTVKARSLTGTGFFLEFLTAPGACPAPLGSKKIRIGDVQATLAGLTHGAGFLLYVENGLLHMLEGYSYEETWPSGVAEFSLSYTDPGRAKLMAALGA